LVVANCSRTVSGLGCDLRVYVMFVWCLTSLEARPSKQATICDLSSTVYIHHKTQPRDTMADVNDPKIAEGEWRSSLKQ
jgi:hypothetical protein